MPTPSPMAVTERSPPIEIDTGDLLRAVTFSADGEHLLCSGRGGLQVWRVADRQRIATLPVDHTTCLAVSKDGKWIAAGTHNGEVFGWNAETYEKLLVFRLEGSVNGVDFSPDSARLVAASSNYTATAWNVATGERIQTLRHDARVAVAKYSPQGDRIATAPLKYLPNLPGKDSSRKEEFKLVTATKPSVRVWDSIDGRLLVDIPIEVIPECNTGLFWLDNHLFIVSESTIRQFEASTGSAVSEWLVHRCSNTPRSALPRHGEFIACPAGRAVSLWDTSIHTKLGQIQHSDEISSIAFSPGDRFLAIGGEKGKVIIKNFEDVSLASYTTSFIEITDTVLDSWKNDRLLEAETSLTRVISNSTRQSHHALANRSLVRSRLNPQSWEPVIDDAENSIKIQPSVVGYIAKSVALIRSGQKEDGFRVFDFSFRHCNQNHVDDLLLIKAVILFMSGKHADAVLRIDDLIAIAHWQPIYGAVQAYMYLCIGNSQMESSDYEGAIYSFERARARMRYRVRFGLVAISLISGWKFDDLGLTVRMRLCEALHAAGRINDAGKSLLELLSTFDEVISETMTNWVHDFIRQCLSTPLTENSDDGMSTYTPLLKVWAKAISANGSWRDALISAGDFAVPKFSIYRAVCERLEKTGRITDASECFCQMMDESAEQANARVEYSEWVPEFKCRCSGKLENLGDTAMNTKQHGDAAPYYTAALALGPAAPQGLLIKRSKAYIASGLWEAALSDANRVVELDPSSPWGYERKHAALHQAGDYKNSINAFETMLSTMSQSSDAEIRELHCRYVNPAATKAVILEAVRETTCHSPGVLINTISGRLLDKHEQTSAFESLPVFNKLISSMMTLIDHDRIKSEVTDFYRYAMFSHKWEDNEPLFEQVKRIVVYDLEDSPTNDKLQMFCKMVRTAGLCWAWSDTCCINKADHFVLQEALVSMFKWYRGSAMTLVLLRGVPSPSRRGDLMRSIWNSRAWTFQEYHASKVVLFYNEDWTPYLNLKIPNHKEAPEIISEMEEATGISARALITLQPGINNIREKLCLASTRQTTLIEDAAYSLLGMFSMSMPIVYGEGDHALGRLLAQLLTSSGDTNILAWTGKSGYFNSCLPSSITVFKQLPTSHIPPDIADAEIEAVTIGLRNTLPNLISVTRFYERLCELRVPSFAGQRMRLPCIVFKLGSFSVSGSESEQVFRARAAALGTVEIRTAENLSQFNSLYLIHPWISFLLGQQAVGNTVDGMLENIDNQSPTTNQPQVPGRPPSATPTPTSCLRFPLGLSFSRRTATRLRDSDAAHLQSSLPLSQTEARALRVLARLRQPFGALLITPSHDGMSAYRRVAAQSQITVQVEEITPVVLEKLADSIRVLDVL